MYINYSSKLNVFRILRIQKTLCRKRWHTIKSDAEGSSGRKERKSNFCQFVLASSQWLHHFWTNTFLDKCFFGQILFWTNTFLDKWKSFLKRQNSNDISAWIPLAWKYFHCIMEWKFHWRGNFIFHWGVRMPVEWMEIPHNPFSGFPFHPFHVSGLIVTVALAS